jgi:peptidylprolyl isomerase
MLLLKGNGKSHLQNTSINYLPGFLKDGTLFDTSIEDVAKTFGNTIHNVQLKAVTKYRFEGKRWDDSGFIEGIEQMSFGTKLSYSFRHI